MGAFSSLVLVFLFPRYLEPVGLTTNLAQNRIISIPSSFQQQILDLKKKALTLSIEIYINNYLIGLLFAVKGSTSKRSWLVHNLSLTTLMKQLNVKTTFIYNQSAVSNRPKYTVFKPTQYRKESVLHSAHAAMAQPYVILNSALF